MNSSMNNEICSPETRDKKKKKKNANTKAKRNKRGSKQILGLPNLVLI